LGILKVNGFQCRLPSYKSQRSAFRAFATRPIVFLGSIAKNQGSPYTGSSGSTESRLSYFDIAQDSLASVHTEHPTL